MNQGPILPKSLSSLIFLAGIVIILALNILFFQSFLTSLVFLAGLFLVYIFLLNPFGGILTLLFVRPLIDSFSESFSIDLPVSLGNFASLSVSSVLGMLAVLMGTVFLIKNRKSLGRYFSRERSRVSISVFVFWILYILIAFISILFSLNKLSSFYEVLRILSIFLFFLFGLAVPAQKTSSLSRLIIFSAGIPFLVSLSQLITGTGLGGTDGIESRLFGTFSHPNSFASFVIIIFALTLYLFWEKNHESQKMPLVMLAALALFIILETYSRGAWLSLLVFGFILSLFKSPKSILVIIALLVGLFLFSQEFRYRVQDIYAPPATSSIRWRFQQWEGVYTSFLARPWTGWGAGTETLVHEYEYGFYAGNPYTHNDALRAFLETGIPGGIIFFLLFSLVSLALFGNFLRLENSSQKTFVLLILALFLAQFSFSMSSNIFRGTATQWTLWFLVGMALAKYPKQKRTV